VQGLKFAVFVPPAVGQVRKLSQLGGIGIAVVRVGYCGSLGHRLIVSNYGFSALDGFEYPAQGTGSGCRTRSIWYVPQTFLHPNKKATLGWLFAGNLKIT
jgi:hypothetical protein